MLLVLCNTVFAADKDRGRVFLTLMDMEVEEEEEGVGRRTEEEEVQEPGTDLAVRTTFNTVSAILTMSMPALRVSTIDSSFGRDYRAVRHVPYRT